MKHCMNKSWLLSFIAVFIFLYVFNMVVHGTLLMDEYLKTADLWRSEEEMRALGFHWWIIYYALLSAVVVCWFKKTRPSLSKLSGAEAMTTCCPVKSGGWCFGLKLGLVMGLLMAVSYLYMPIGESLAVKWFLTGLAQGLGVGVILGMTCKGTNTCAVKEAKEPQ